MDKSNILIVKVPDHGTVNVWELQNYILESLAQGVLVLPDDASCDVMELPMLGGIKLEPEWKLLAPPPLEPDPDAEPMNVELRGGRGAKKKKIIQDRLIVYRKEHGLGCWKKVAEASGGRLSEEDLRGMYEGAPFTLASWRIADMALDELERKAAADGDSN